MMSSPVALMPRRAGRKGESVIYHIMLRGQNRQIIFEDNEDKDKFMYTIYDGTVLYTSEPCKGVFGE
jgi:hypothetical protein